MKEGDKDWKGREMEGQEKMENAMIILLANHRRQNTVVYVCVKWQ